MINTFICKMLHLIRNMNLLTKEKGYSILEENVKDEYQR